MIWPSHVVCFPSREFLMQRLPNLPYPIVKLVLGPGALTSTTKVWFDDRCYKSQMGIVRICFFRTVRTGHVKYLPDRDYHNP